VTELQVIARYTIKAGHQDEVLDLLRRLTEVTRAEAGCLAFDVYRHIDDDRRVTMVQRYASRQAFDLHRTLPHHEEIVAARVAPLLEERAFETFEVPVG
jgi:quinol monooxygenase YgiN